MASKKQNGPKVKEETPASPPLLILNSSTGLKLIQGSSPYKIIQQLTSASVRALCVSQDGNVLAHSEGPAFHLIKLAGESFTGNRIQVKEQVHDLFISPKSTYLATFCSYKSPSAGQPDEPNLLIHTVADGNPIGSYICKKQVNWHPQWSADESLFLRLNGTELHCYEGGKFDRWARKSENHKISSFSLVQNTRNNNNYVACYTGGTSGQPSTIRIYRYPNMSSPMTTKSFFKADSVQIMWSPRGDCLLYLCICEVDKSGKSYYGEQKLNFMEANPSGSGYIVPVKKEGPIHNVAWLPGITDVQKYVVIHGFVPPRVSMFDVKGNLIFDFGGQEYSYNQIVINPFGNLVALAGFGNMRGGVSVWEMEQKKLVSEFSCQDSTNISWAPDGSTLLTATTSPRLRVGNGFKLWKYNGSVLVDMPVESSEVELYSVQWQPRPGQYSMPKVTISAKPVTISSAAPAKYVPPSIRNRNEFVSQIKQQGNSGNQQQSQQSGQATGQQRMTGGGRNRSQATGKQQQQQPQQSTNDAASGASGKNEMDKNIAKINRKLAEIDKLKNAQNLGSELKKDQLVKISKEQELRTQLQQLQLSK